MKTITVALLLLVNFNVSAKFYKGTILLMDGNSKNGYIELPDYPDDKKLKFREEERGETEKIEIDLVKSFEIVNDKNINIKFITIYLAGMRLKISLRYFDNQKSWVKVVKEGKINLYSASSVYTPHIGGGVTYTYIQKENDNKYAYFIASDEGGSNEISSGISLLKKSIGKVFENDCPKLAQLINKEDIKKNGLEYIIELYDKNCGK